MPTPDQPPAQHQAVLAELTAMGLDIARTLHKQITATPQLMENRITRNDRPVENPDALRRELLDRLDGSGIAADLIHRPLPDLVDELCQDMGLHRLPFVTPYPRRTPHDIARLLAQAEGHHNPDPHAPAWTHSGPHRLASPRGTPNAHGITPEDRALHAHILAQGRQRR